ncbi:hypothetical protein V8E53_010366 [Lactarius tabidus]
MPHGPAPTLQNTWGVSLVGQLVSTMLTGFELVQVWIYCWNYWNKDKRTFKFFLVFLIVIDMLSTVMGTYLFYWFLVLNYGNVQDLGFCLWSVSIRLQTIFNAVPGTAVQFLGITPGEFTSPQLDIRPVSESIIFPIIVVPLILAANTIEFYITIKAATEKENSRVRIPFWLVTLWIGGTVLADISITTMMSWTLYRKKTGFARTDSMIKTLMTYTINSGILLSALGAAMLISFSVAPTTFFYVAFFVVLSKCYINSLLAMLNTRDYVCDRSSTDRPDNTFNLASIRLSDTHESKSRQPGVTVIVHHSTTSNRVQTESDHTLGSTSEVPKPV